MTAISWRRLASACIILSIVLLPLMAPVSHTVLAALALRNEAAGFFSIIIQLSIDTPSLTLRTGTGEHGVGVGKKEYLVDELGEGTVELMKRVKDAIDPNHIMNPGKVS